MPKDTAINTLEPIGDAAFPAAAFPPAGPQTAAAPQPDLAAALAAFAQALAAQGPARPAPGTAAPGGAGPAPKHWLRSMTILGAALTVATTVLPVVAPLLGLPITPQLVQLLGDQLFQVLQAVGGVAGTGLIVAGRARAAAPLARGEVTLRL